MTGNLKTVPGTAAAAAAAPPRKKYPTEPTKHLSQKLFSLALGFRRNFQRQDRGIIFFPLLFERQIITFCVGLLKNDFKSNFGNVGSVNTVFQLCAISLEILVMFFAELLDKEANTDQRCLLVLGD